MKNMFLRSLSYLATLTPPAPFVSKPLMSMWVPVCTKVNICFSPMNLLNIDLIIRPTTTKKHLSMVEEKLFLPNKVT